MASRILAMTKENTGLASPRSVFEVKVAAFARFEFALNLQSLKNLLARVWAFSMAMDMSTHLATSYLDMAEFVKGLAVCTVNLLTGVISIVAERGSSNELPRRCPPCILTSWLCFKAESSVTF